MRGAAELKLCTTIGLHMSWYRGVKRYRPTAVGLARPTALHSQERQLAHTNQLSSVGYLEQVYLPIIFINEGVVRASRVIGGSYCDVVEPLRGPRSYPIVGRSIVRTPGVISTTAHGLAGSPSDDEISGRWCDLRRHPARRGGGGGSGGSGGGFGTERLLLDSEEENDDGEDEDEAEEEEEVVEEEEEAAEVRLELPAMSRQPRVIGERELSRDLRESRDPRDHRDSRDSDHIVRTKYRDQDYNYETHNSATPVTAVTASSGHTANPVSCY
ncbi:hypothetical protein PV325_002547 [Microctonus aethiopoides]|nr:hypothetical protein PV325_002547 [Microctonus aethiopoides]